MTGLSSQDGVVLGVDSGSTKVGLALFRQRDLVKAETVKCYAGKVSAQRVARLCERVDSVLDQWLSAETSTVTCVMETPGKQGGRQHSKALIGIGMGVGALSVCLHRRGFDMQFVDVTKWSRLEGGKAKSKEDRARRIASMFSAYDAKNDHGLDAADAIGVAAFWLGLFNG